MVMLVHKLLLMVYLRTMSQIWHLNLGFSGFRRGSYDFYKTDWKYLNDATTRGIIGDIVQGVLVPAGTTQLYMIKC